MEQQIKKGSAEEKKAKKERAWNYTLKTFIVVGLIILLGLGIFLPLKFVPSAVSSVAATLRSLFISAEKFDVRTNKTSVVGGEDFTITWNGGSEDGQYILQYDCAGGVEFERATSVRERIVCGVPFYFTSANESITLHPIAQGSTPTDVSLRFSYKKSQNDSLKEMGKISIRVNTPPTSGNVTPPQATPPLETPSNQASTTPSQNSTTREQSSKPDLLIGFLGKGVINPITNQFVAKEPLNNNERPAIRFQVINAGSARTGSWRFTALLPTLKTVDSLYTSPAQTSLASGDGIEFILGFDEPKTGLVNIIISIDPLNAVQEESENNNTLSVPIQISDIGNQSADPRPDLSLRILARGSVNRQTGQFFETQNVYEGDRAAVRFEVENQGATQSGIWEYIATLPGGSNVYRGSNEMSLLPGQKISYTVTYDARRLDAYQNIVIQLDPSNIISEKNEGNNSASTVIAVY